MLKYFGLRWNYRPSFTEVFFSWFVTSGGLLELDSQKVPQQIERQLHCSCQNSVYLLNSEALPDMLIYIAKISVWSWKIYSHSPFWGMEGSERQQESSLRKEDMTSSENWAQIENASKIENLLLIHFLGFFLTWEWFDVNN